MECSLRRALQGTLAILTRVQPKDLDAPTPCASWDVRALVKHFVGTARWWAATVSGGDGVADADLDPVLAAGLLGLARLTVPDASRGPDGEALFGPAREVPAGAGPAGQLAAFLGRVV